MTGGPLQLPARCEGKLRGSRLCHTPVADLRPPCMTAVTATTWMCRMPAAGQHEAGSAAVWQSSCGWHVVVAISHVSCARMIRTSAALSCTGWGWCTKDVQPTARMGWGSTNHPKAQMNVLPLPLTIYGISLWAGNNPQADTENSPAIHLQDLCLHQTECPFQPLPLHCHVDRHQAPQSTRGGGRARAACQDWEALPGGSGWQRAPQALRLHRCILTPGLSLPKTTGSHLLRQYCFAGILAACCMILAVSCTSAGY